MRDGFVKRKNGARRALTFAERGDIIIHGFEKLCAIDSECSA